MTSLFYHNSAFRFAGLMIVCAALLTLGSCSSGKGAARAGSKIEYSKSKYPVRGKGQIQVDKSLPEQTQALLREADKWLGTKYRYGGNTTAGVDCSGLMCNLFNIALSIKLPRSSAQQKEYCSSIKRKDLIVGDLVFFKTSSKGKINHVGMYIGDGKMVHASSSKGVIITSLNDDYFKRTYHSSGRIDQYYALIKGKKRKKKDRQDVPVVPPQLETPVDYEGAILANASVTKTTAQPGKSTRAALERTRRKVLDDAIEQKVDSIVSAFFD